MTESESTNDRATRAGFVALIGEPNAGKSTLLNQMVGAKVSIVTHKVQTTRARIRGVAVEDNAQIIFVDTPGLFQPRRSLDRAMVAAAWAGAADADVTALMVEAHRGVTEGVERILSSLPEKLPKKPIAQSCTRQTSISLLRWSVAIASRTLSGNALRTRRPNTKAVARAQSRFNAPS